MASVKAAQNLKAGAQTTAQDDEDYRQVASSIVTLSIVIGMFALGPIASRIGKTLGQRLKNAAARLAGSAPPQLPALATPAPGAVARPPSGAGVQV